MKKYIISVLSLVFIFDANAAIKVNNKTAERYIENYSESKDDDAGIDEQELIETLENDIRILDEEIDKCKKQKKTWVAATVIGAAGVVATGTAAAVQGVQLQQQKDAFAPKNEQLRELKKDLGKLENNSN